MENRKLNRRDFLRLSAAAATGAVLAACAPATPQVIEVEKQVPVEKVVVQTVEVEKEVPVAPKPAQKVFLKYQSREPEMAGGVLKLWEEFYPQFQAANPGIEVMFLPMPSDFFQQTVTSVAAGTAADIIEHCCWVSTYFVQKKATLNLQPFIDRDRDELDMEDYMKTQFDAWKDEKGDIHLMPRFTGDQVLYWNVDLFKELGVDPLPTTWKENIDHDDYDEIGQKFVLREAPFRWATSNYGMGGKGSGSNWCLQIHIRAWGAHMVDPQDHNRCGLNEPPGVEALEWCRRAIWDTRTFAYGAEMGGLGVVPLFLGERIAMMEMGPWQLGPTAEAAKFKWDLAPFPDGPGGHTSHNSVDGSFIWNGTKHPEEAWVLLKWLTSPLYGKLYAKWAFKQPSRKSLHDYWMKIVREQQPILQNVRLEVMTECTMSDIGMPEEMFNNDQTCKDDILGVAFDKVMLLGEKPVSFIKPFCELVERYNRGEVSPDALGGEIEALMKG